MKIKDENLPLKEIQFMHTNSTCFYEEDYIKHKEGKTFADLIKPLGAPVDEDELMIIANAAYSILRRRDKILDKANKISKGMEAEGNPFNFFDTVNSNQDEETKANDNSTIQIEGTNDDAPF